MACGYGFPTQSTTPDLPPRGKTSSTIVEEQRSGRFDLPYVTDGRRSFSRSTIRPCARSSGRPRNPECGFHRVSNISAGGEDDARIREKSSSPSDGRSF
jgi:hypothetical protein